jgi:hypothetical protein
VIAQQAHPSYEDQNDCPNSTFDVALLRLAAPVTGVNPVEIAAHPPRRGALCRAVGYGVHNGPSGSTTVEQRRSATETVASVDETAIEVAKKSGIVDHGDSGGPLLCGGRIVGVTSCGNDPSPAHTSAYYGRVDAVADWISATVASWQ